MSHYLGELHWIVKYIGRENSSVTQYHATVVTYSTDQTPK